MCVRILSQGQKGAWYSQKSCLLCSQLSIPSDFLPSFPTLFPWLCSSLHDQHPYGFLTVFTCFLRDTVVNSCICGSHWQGCHFTEHPALHTFPSVWKVCLFCFLSLPPQLGLMSTQDPPRPLGSIGLRVTAAWYFLTPPLALLWPLWVGHVLSTEEIHPGFVFRFSEFVLVESIVSIGTWGDILLA